MQSFKQVMSRKDEQENLRNFLFSLAAVAALVVVFFGFHAVSFLIHGSPDPGVTQVAAVEGEPFSE